MLQEVFQQRVGETLGVGPLGVAEDAVERGGVGPLDGLQGALQGRADVPRRRAHVAPVGPLGDLEAVRLGELREAWVAVLLDGRAALVVPDVADALEEEQREDVGLEIRRVDGAAEDVRGLPEVVLESVRGDRGGVFNGQRGRGRLRGPSGLRAGHRGVFRGGGGRGR